MLELIKQLKPLRVALLLCAVTTMVLKPDNGATAVYNGWEVVPTLLMPVFAVIFFMLLLLDTLMATVWKSQSSGSELLRYRRIQQVNLVATGLLLIIWLPYFIALTN